ncbi:hypothetical protein K474DRAFT_1051869 [Panus rudis PR-1116 ss-1]|nr:hypothetical protein K474DRAFT_1051869 [Panus rudis PR-1116 ss-1]
MYALGDPSLLPVTVLGFTTVFSWSSCDCPGETGWRWRGSGSLSLIGCCNSLSAIAKVGAVFELMIRLHPCLLVNVSGMRIILDLT